MATDERNAPTEGQAKRGISPPWILILVFSLMCIGASLYLFQQTAGYKTVVIAIGDQPPIELKSRAARVQDALDEAGVVLGLGDRVSPDLDAPLRDGVQIVVELGKRVIIEVDGGRMEVAAPMETVRDALVAGDIRMGSLDRVVPVRETPIEDGMEILVIRVTQEEIVETEPIPFRTLRWAEPHLPRGEEQLIREGQEGLLATNILVTYENGEVAHRKVLSHEVVQEAVAEIIGVGTREAVQVLQTETGSYRYKDVIDMVATAYYPGPESTGEWADGFTFTGLRAGYGVVAVDPAVIPLGTRLYVPGYGEAIAADIGGAIKGYRIDLGFETYRDAINYGRQNVKVYILE